MNSPQVGIVIVTHNNAAVIEPCIKSVQAIRYSNISIIVVDNASTDETKKILKKYNDIEIIENKKNSTYADANNQGIKVFLSRNYEFILLLNPDTEVKSEIIEKLMKPFEEVRVGIVGCVITYHNSNKIWYGGGTFNRIFCYTRHDKMNWSVDTLKGEIRKTDFVTGCCMMIRSSIFKKTGFLDPVFGFYFEDVDFCLKSQSAGYVTKVIEVPLVSHRVSVSTGIAGSNRLTPFKAYFYGRNPFILMNHHIWGIWKVTAVFGQLFIRLPFHAYTMIRNKDWWALFEYIRGMREGMR